MIPLSSFDIARFWSRVRADKYLCWKFEGHCTAAGYAVFTANAKHYRAMRVIYQLVKGAIPAGLVLDHLCRNRWCINPDHLEAVTNKENTLRGESFTAVNARRTECPYGHPLIAGNLRPKKNGGRGQCRECYNRRSRERLRVKEGYVKDLTHIKYTGRHPIE